MTKSPREEKVKIFNDTAEKTRQDFEEKPSPETRSELEQMVIEASLIVATAAQNARKKKLPLH